MNSNTHFKRVYPNKQVWSYKDDYNPNMNLVNIYSFVRVLVDGKYYLHRIRHEFKLRDDCMHLLDSAVNEQLLKKIGDIDLKKGVLDENITSEPTPTPIDFIWDCYSNNFKSNKHKKQ